MPLRSNSNSLSTSFSSRVSKSMSLLAVLSCSRASVMSRVRLSLAAFSCSTVSVSFGLRMRLRSISLSSLRLSILAWHFAMASRISCGVLMLCFPIKRIMAWLSSSTLYSLRNADEVMTGRELYSRHLSSPITKRIIPKMASTNCSILFL